MCKKAAKRCAGILSSDLKYNNIRWELSHVVHKFVYTRKLQYMNTQQHSYRESY